MKFPIITTLLLLLGTVNTYSQKLNCQDFRTGKFELIDEINQQKYIYERFENFQTEETFDMKTGKVFEEKGYYILTWINDCEYNLKLDTTKTKGDDIALAVNARGGVNSRIVFVDGSCAVIAVTIADEKIETAYGMCKID
ncbi:hypothetical protein [Flavobacterium ginsenosidimutans]|uniref:Uncharacterized protein n=1 Tax=Flavobacterium ginsenosidimutans TaxID=687844 RepID=A0ABZ2QC02_9FLAO